MSTGESIYDLIPKPVPIPEKNAMYRSKHDAKVPPTFSTFGLKNTSKPGYDNVAGHTTKVQTGYHEYQKPFATMGKDGNAMSTTDVLRKGTGGGGGAGMATAKARSTSEFQPHSTSKPPVPTAEECKKSSVGRELKETKDFITSNAVENILAVPRPQPAGEDWLKKPNFGQVPQYLKKIKKEIQDEYEYVRAAQKAYEEASLHPPGMRLLPEDERLQLIDQLKQKWDQVNGLYQSSSCLSLASLDTIGKVKRKEQYEAQLAQIEKDVEMLSKPMVYVKEDE